MEKGFQKFDDFDFEAPPTSANKEFADEEERLRNGNPLEQAGAHPCMNGQDHDDEITLTKHDLDNSGWKTPNARLTVQDYNGLNIRKIQCEGKDCARTISEMASSAHKCACTCNVCGKLLCFACFNKMQSEDRVPTWRIEAAGMKNLRKKRKKIEMCDDIDDRERKRQRNE